MRDASSRTAASSRAGARMVALRVAASVSSPHATPSSICLVECGSLKMLAKKNWRKSS